MAPLGLLPSSVSGRGEEACTLEVSTPSAEINSEPGPLGQA